MIDYLPEIESDFSVLHRVEDPYQLPAPRFFSRAERFPYYNGAVRGALLLSQQEQPAPHYQEQREEPIVTVEASTLPAIQPDENFAGVEYTA